MSGKLHIDYAQYHHLIDRVVQAVQQSGFLPDCVLGVSRGGLFLADGLSRSLRKPMAVIAASSYREEAGTSQGELQISASIAAVSPVKGRVLLVDDLADTGHTMQALCGHLQAICPGISELKTAVVWVKPGSVFKPDFAAEYLESDVWIVQPFETRDFL
ncbi:MAG: phosphoribosyltransferase [Burkholderiales bacterium]|jgi:hypoxanthine phosphoribosyltransferase|uniref:phosphoribosyltransferase n=1 Tax=Limnobacter sp. TaxID=2003368 RepID=UPI0039BCC1B0|nr:phosphoribosyltransferase [Burkholderiales bacterium]